MWRTMVIIQKHPPVFFTTFQVVIKVITGDKFPRSIETLHCEYALSNDIIEGILFSEIQLSFLYK